MLALVGLLSGRRELAGEQNARREPLHWSWLDPKSSYLDEPGCPEEISEGVDGPAVGRRDLVIEGLPAVEAVVPALEGKQEVPAACDDPRELGERRGRMLRQRVDGRVVSEHAAERAVRDVEIENRPDVEGKVRSIALGNVDQCWREVDSARGQPE